MGLLAVKVEWRFMSDMLLQSLIGQDLLKERLQFKVDTEKRENWSMPHMLFCGPEGSGKATFAKAVGAELGRVSISESVKEWRSALDMNGPLTNVEPGGVVIIENLDILQAQFVPGMLSVLRDNIVKLQIGTGPGARTHAISLPVLTIIATCTDLSRVQQDFLPWLTVEEFGPYSKDALTAVTNQQAEALGFSIEGPAAQLLASVSNGLPGGTQTLLQRIAKLGLVRDLTETVLLQALSMLGLPTCSNSQAGLLQQLRSMSGEEFERWVAALFRGLGYSATLTKVVGDHGIDLFLQRGSDRLAVQCKRWTDSVGESTVRDFFGSLLNAGISHGMIVTTSTFSSQARIFAEKNGIRLLDLGALTQITIHGEDGLNSVKPARRNISPF
jgi:Holliday junction resolvasome RuvABC ATP-dependent DNA helicase subunit